MTDETRSQVADVYKEQTRVGSITRTDAGSVFEYDAAYLASVDPAGGIAYHLPHARKRIETFGVNLHPFFAGLLPEGARLESLTRWVKTSRDDLLTLLIAAGTDCIGDIAVVPEHAGLKELAPDVEVHHFEEVSFAELFQRSISYESAEEGVIREISLPGVQDKISAGLISFPVRAKKKNKAFILKLNTLGKPRLVENECFFLRMANDLNLPSARGQIVVDRDGVSGLLVERFDRIAEPSLQRLAKLHQEDACQFLDRYPADKYARISCRMIAEGMERFCTTPIIEIAKFIRLVAFSYLIGNGDLHAKNVSIMTLPHEGRTVLTPAYDLLSTLPYGDNRMALSFEGRDDNLRRSDFINFGARHGVRKPVVESILDELCEGALTWIPRLGEIGLTEKATKHLEAVISKRCEDLRRKQ